MGEKNTPKSTLGRNGLKNFTLIHFVENLREQNLLLDYHLTDAPFVQNGAIVMLAKGEISWRGKGGTPFYPPNVRIPLPQSVHMVEFFATDYIANSMLYHAYRQHLMDVVVGPESSPQLKDLLFTSCGSSFCIGEYLGTLGEQYPNRQVEVIFTARKAPLIVFVENRARFRLHGRMNMYVRPNNKTQVKEMIIRSDTTMTANVNMWLNSTRIVGNATIENLDFRLLETKIIRSDTTMTANVNMWLNSTRIVGNATIENLDFRLLETKIKDVDQASFGDLGLFGAEFLEKLLTEILQLGITMPTMMGVQLKSPRLTFHERYLRVQTYFKLDEHFTSDLVQTAVRQTLTHVG
ncbi:LBP / BPI / CETP family protein [Dictyocaulus viviparus]|uniref:LBP / BPI / CETP family protein n=1 Tax=Dictyocaulus viviparus TaxID=29172 RepID=A0A0D8XQE9_DICVI|nr:LBP / BPI / CETP family protein [Dictyocaulus viviparus]